MVRHISDPSIRLDKVGPATWKPDATWRTLLRSCDGMAGHKKSEATDALAPVKLFDPSQDVFASIFGSFAKVPPMTTLNLHGLYMKNPFCVKSFFNFDFSVGGL